MKTSIWAAVPVISLAGFGLAACSSHSSVAAHPVAHSAAQNTVASASSLSTANPCPSGMAPDQYGVCNPGGKAPTSLATAPAPAPSTPKPYCAQDTTDVAPQYGVDCKADIVTFKVFGDTSAVDVTYGPAGSNDQGYVGMSTTMTIPANPPLYYAINAQLQGSGDITAEILVDGQVISKGTASGGYNIATAEIGQNPLTNQWEDDNTG